MRMYLAYGDNGGKFYIGEAGLAAYGPDILTPPHLVKLPPRPEPEPLTEDELAEIERQYEQDAPSIGYYPNIPALIAEVRRLRVENASLSDALEYPDEGE